MLIMISALAALIIGFASIQFLGKDNLIEQGVENIIEEEIERIMHLPEDSMNIDLSPEV